MRPARAPPGARAGVARLPRSGGESACGTKPLETVQPHHAKLTAAWEGGFAAARPDAVPQIDSAVVVILLLAARFGHASGCRLRETPRRSPATSHVDPASEARRLRWSSPG
jgi:hypothetical protein